MAESADAKNNSISAISKTVPGLADVEDAKKRLAGLKNQRFTEVTPYLYRFPFFLCLLYTVEVTGSNPVSPTIPLPKTPTFRNSS
jgi:hypothetical protein